MDNIIDISSVRPRSRVISILPAVEDTLHDVADEHTAEPIKSVETVQLISDYLIQNERWRDNMLFILGINFGLRVSDLITLRFSHLIDEGMTFKETFPILEKKTKNTRKVKKNRYLTINDSVIDAVMLYLDNTSNVRLSDFLFKSESNRGSNVNTPISRQSVDRILKGIADDLSLDIKIATHSLRKTFAYHQMMMSGNDPRKLLLLQKMFGHSSALQTLTYIGITTEEISDAYLKLNLGSKNCYDKYSSLSETEDVYENSYNEFSFPKTELCAI